jgi:hypothetical protein
VRKVEGRYGVERLVAVPSHGDLDLWKNVAYQTSFLRGYSKGGRDRRSINP